MQDRVAMCESAAASTDWIAVDSWEARQKEYVRTGRVLARIAAAINAASITGLGDREVELRLVCGSDLLDSVRVHKFAAVREHVRHTTFFVEVCASALEATAIF
eukprot:SAG31_NODE_33018_length_349_cov_0.576000_1_plen_103_part_01